MTFEIIEIIKTLDAAFGLRTLNEHRARPTVLVIPGEALNTMLVFDLGTSRKILLSKSFAGFNYFKAGMEWLARSGKDVSILNDFYNSTLLFQEGEMHRAWKSQFSRLLEEASAELDAMKPQILRYFRKRRSHVRSPLDYSMAIVRLCAGLVIARLTSRPLRTVFRALAIRRNIFFPHFHPARHIASGEALQRLYVKAMPPNIDSPEWINHLLAQSLITMGIDPMIASICASIVEGQIEPMTSGVYRYSPVSFVSRVCTAPARIDGLDYAVGDVCYVSLLPSAEADVNPSAGAQSASLSFGLGLHTCIGKRISLKILEIAEKVLRDVYGQGFSAQSEIAPDGAFLAFRNVK